VANLTTDGGGGGFWSGCFVTDKFTNPFQYYQKGYNILTVTLKSLPHFVNDYYYSLNQLHCNGALSLDTSPTNPRSFLTNAPEDLVEDYWVCK
jgi:hypothetical protein